VLLAGEFRRAAAFSGEPSLDDFVLALRPFDA
jgi:hypothetical protein